MYVLDVAEDDDTCIRIDAYAAAHIPDITRSQLDLSTTTFTNNGIPLKKSKKIHPGMHIEVTIARQESSIEPEPVDFPIIYEDEHVVAVNKPQGLVVHPAAGNWHGTLVHGLLYRYQQLQELDDCRPGIVHRLDKDTSGVMIVAKDSHTLEFLSHQFSSRTVKKIYIAIIKGNVQKRRGSIKTQIVRDRRNRKRFTTAENEHIGKYAETHYTVLKQYDGFSLVSLTLKTGRTHQLRVHMKYIGHPIIGDPLYSRKNMKYPEATLMLHALSLQIDIPEGNGMVHKKFVAPLPDRFKKILRSSYKPS